MTYTTDKAAAINAMATPAERKLASEVVGERVRRWKIFQKLTELAEAWIVRRRRAISVREKEPVKPIQGIRTYAH